MVISKDDIEAFATTKEQKDFWRIDMKIEVGKTYQIDPLYKKSLVEIEQFKKDVPKIKAFNPPKIIRSK